MKEYKLGDTIYLKGTVGQVDDTSLPYCVEFVNSEVWITDDEIADSYNPVKPILPKKVADEISFAKSIKGVTFDDYIVRELIYSDYDDSATNNMIKSSDVSNVIEVLLNAWNNGYTVEKEPVSLVYVTGTNKKFLYNKRGDGSTRAAKLETPIVPSPVTSYQTAYDQYKPLYWFADAEITKFGLQDCEREEAK